MKLKKIAAMIAAAAAAVSMMAMDVAATNWANASYADNDPNTVKIISTDENKVVFGATGDGIAMKCRVVAGDLIAAEDLPKVKSASWTVTYDVSAAKEFTWLGGGTYAAFKNSSTQYSVDATYDEFSNPVSYEGATLTFNDSVKYLMAKETLAADSEFVFMDWSNTNLASNGITMTVSNLKFFDGDGNEIAQLPYGASAEAAPAETEAAPAETEAASAETEAAPAETEAAPVEDDEEDIAVDDTDVDEAPAETEAAPAETEAAPAPVADATTTPAATGNVAVASIAAVMAVAGAAAIVAKKRK